MRTSWKNVRYLTNDPRTTLLAVAVINLCVMGSANTTTLLLATIITSVLFASVASPRGVIIFLLLEALFLAFTNKAALLGANSINAFFISISFWMSRFTITATIGLYAIYSISVSQLSAALRQIRMPKNFVSAIMVMLRFLPTVIQEFRAIQDAMKLRGIRLSATSSIIHPMRTVQYLLVPLLAGVVRIADDLTASAVIRGLGSQVRPSPLIPTTFRFSDLVILASLVLLCIARIRNIELVPPIFLGSIGAN